MLLATWKFNRLQGTKHRSNLNPFEGSKAYPLNTLHRGLHRNVTLDKGRRGVLQAGEFNEATLVQQCAEPTYCSNRSHSHVVTTWYICYTACQKLAEMVEWMQQLEQLMV